MKCLISVSSFYETVLNTMSIFVNCGVESAIVVGMLQRFRHEKQYANLARMAFDNGTWGMIQKTGMYFGRYVVL